MAGRPSAATVAAMKLVLAGATPYRAIKQTNIAPSTMYRTPLYKAWRAAMRETDPVKSKGMLAQLREELNERDKLFDQRAKTT